MTRSPSLKRTIIHRLIFPVILFITIETALSYFVTLHYANAIYDKWLLDSAYSLAQEVKVKQDKIAVELPNAAQEIFTWDNVDTTFFTIISEDQKLLISNHSEMETLAFPASKKPIFSDTKINGKSVRMISMPVPSDLPENVYIHVAETLNKRRNMTFEILLADLLPQLLLTLLVSLYLFKSLNRGLAPLNQLATEISRRSPTDLNPVSKTQVYAEVSTLTDTINSLLKKLSQAIAAQQRFIANAAHQLRTPLAGLKLQAERAQREKNISTMLPALLQMQNSAERASHMISQLLLLARSGSIEGKHLFEIVDLQNLVKNICIEWVPKALKKEIELSYEGHSSQLLINGDKILLTELINNLLDNAIKYSHEHGNIVVKLEEHPAPRLIIEDDGPGIKKTELDKIFERFYRPADSPGNGSGLGLAIVKEITTLHQGKLTLGQSTLGGTRVEIKFQKPF